MWTGADGVALAGRLGELDPLAEVLIDLRCELCGQQWQALFDRDVLLE